MTPPNDLPLFAHASTRSSVPSDVPVIADAPRVEALVQVPVPVPDSISGEPSTHETDGSRSTPNGIKAPDERVRPDLPLPKTLSDAWQLLKAYGELSKDALRHIQSDLTMLEKVTGRRACDLPCSPAELRPIIQPIRHAKHNLKKSRWTTIKSSVARILRAVGWVDPEATTYLPLDGLWKVGVDRLPQPGQKASFTGFARFCTARNINPSDVTLEEIQAYQTWRVQRTIGLSVDHLTAIIRRHWTFLQRNCPGWPQAPIAPLPNSRRDAMAAECFPQSFQTEVQYLIRDMAKFLPLDPRFKKKYSSYTIAATRQTIYQAATVIAVARGGCNNVASLRDVGAPAAFAIIMNDHFERVGSSDAWAPSAKTFAITLKRVATLSQKLSEGEMKEIVTMIETIKPSNGGLSLRSRDKVAQFHDPNIMQQLVELPNRLFMESDTLFKSGLLDRAARLHARALQLAILLTNPLRRKTLSALDIDRHFTRDKNGRFTRILIPSSDVKNGRVIEAIMPDELVERLHRHIQLHRQTFLNGTASSFLFPGKLSGHVSPDTVSRAIKSLVETEIGVDFNVHLVRHIVATLLLEDDPRNMPVAQQMLGHWQCKSIERQYGHARGYAAQKAWNSKLANYRDKEAGKRIGRN